MFCSQLHHSRGVLGAVVPGVGRILSVRVDGLREAVSETVVIESMDGSLLPMEASSSKSAIDGACRERHQTKKARQHEYTITADSQLWGDHIGKKTHTIQG
jgi:hypothetical protein